MDFQTIEKEALELGSSERAELIQRLILSLDAMSEAEAREAWLDEAGRRASEIDSGTVKLVPADEVKLKARALLR